MAETADTSKVLSVLSREVRLFVFGQAADTARVPQPPEIAAAVGRLQSEGLSPANAGIVRSGNDAPQSLRFFARNSTHEGTQLERI